MKKLQKQFSLDIHIELLLKIRVLNNRQYHKGSFPYQYLLI